MNCGLGGTLHRFVGEYPQTEANTPCANTLVQDNLLRNIREEGTHTYNWIVGKECLHISIWTLGRANQTTESGRTKNCMQ